MGIRQPLIPSPSNEVLSSDWTGVDIGPSPIDPVHRFNGKIVEPVPFNEVYRIPRQSEFNTMQSMFDIVETLWWPMEIPWERAHAPLFRSEIDQQYAAMPKGHLSTIYDRSNIRQPHPVSQGGLQVLSEDSEGIGPDGY